MADYADWRTYTATYRYWFLSKPGDSSSIQSVGGNYMFVRCANNLWHAVYVGIADDLSQRIPTHERWAEAARLGATHVVAHKQTDVRLREAEEKDLIRCLNPPLNVQHRSGRSSLLG